MATGSNQASKPPQDIVAIFHASFHPTRGNILDWSLRASDDIQLDGVEFSSLPSGLHLVEQDIVYFSSDTHRGVCVFRRRQTSEHGQRGFRLSSLGILLAPSLRPRPWRHVSALKALAHEIYSSLDERPRGFVGEPEGNDWAPARRFFNERMMRRTDLGGAGEWRQWSEELDENHGDPDGDTSVRANANPTLQLPHILRILGPSSLTLYKHVLGRRRILIYTQPPIEAACILCQVAADMCFEDQAAVESVEGVAPRPRQRGKRKEGINVLGAITLHDISVLEHESNTGCGWIACTTDAVFMEKPEYYDLVIDMTSFSPERASRPGLQLSVWEPNGRSRKPSYRLSTIRFTWSDVKLWNELDRILQLDAGTNGLARAPPSLWTDAWRLYEDMCVACAGLWTGGRTTRSNNGLNEAEEQVYVDDPDADASVRVRARGEGIEGRPIVTSERSYRYASRPYAPGTPPSIGPKYDDDEEQEEGEEDAVLVCNRQRKTTLALLQTLHAQTRFWLSRLDTLLPDPDKGETMVQLTPRDVLELELSPLSSIDARFVEWLAEEYGAGARVSVRRGWRDLLGLVFTLGGGPSGPSL